MSILFPSTNTPTHRDYFSKGIAPDALFSNLRFSCHHVSQLPFPIHTLSVILILLARFHCLKVAYATLLWLDSYVFFSYS